jgi:hypothetical protein
VVHLRSVQSSCRIGSQYDFERPVSQAVKSGSSRPGKSRRASPLPTFIRPQLSQPVEKPPSGLNGCMR